MTIYTQDFAEYTTGSAPSDWTDRWGSNWTTNVESHTGGYGGKRLVINPDTADQRKLLTWDDIDSDSNRDDAEVLVRFRTASNGGTYQAAIGVRCAGTLSTNEDGYFVVFGDAYSYRIGIAKLDNSTWTDIVYNNNWPNTDTDAGWYWVRFRVNGTSLKARWWRYNHEEPETWFLDTTDSAVTAAGWVGIWQYESTSPDSYIDYFAVGTNGDSPSLPTDTDQTSKIAKQVLQVGMEETVAPRVTWVGAEVMSTYVAPTMRVDQAALETIEEYNPTSDMRVNQATLETVEAFDASPDMRLDQIALEIITKTPVTGDYVVVCINT